jgi:hypothetical protein
LVLKKGIIKEGEWFKGDLNGFGYFLDTNLNKYEGDWSYDEYNGKGKYIYNNGDNYDGFFRNDKRIGKGIYTTNDGFQYEFLFKDNINLYADKVEKECIRNMNIKEKGKIYYANGDIYEGFVF